MKSSYMSLNQAYESLILYFTSQKKENRVFDLQEALEFLKEKTAAKSPLRETQPETLQDVLHEASSQIPSIKPDSLGISVALDRVIVNLRQLRTFNIKKDLFLGCKDLHMSEGSVIRNKAPYGSGQMCASGQRDNIFAEAREISEEGSGLDTALTELKLAIEGNIRDAERDEFAVQAGIVEAFRKILDTIGQRDFLDSINLILVGKKIIENLRKPPAFMQ